MQIALEERTIGHDAFENIKRILELIEEIDTTQISNIGIEMLERTRTTFSFLKESLEKVDPWLVSENTMVNINNPIKKVLHELTLYANDTNDQRINNIFSYLESILTYAPHFVISKTPDDIEGIRQSVVRFRSSVGQHLGNVERDFNHISNAMIKNTDKLNDLTDSIENQKQRIDSIVSDFQKQFLENQSLRTEKFNDFIKIGEQELNASIESFHQTNDEGIAYQKSEFNSLFENLQNQMAIQEKSFDALVETLKDKVQNELKEMSEMNNKAEKILGLMSMKGLAHGYQEIANKEATKALTWNIISILSLLGILWFGFEFIVQHKGTLSWTALISRMILTGVGITLFTYSAQQANNHRNEERRNRKIELELASLDPYLKDLEEIEQKKVKQNLVGKYFGVDFPNTSVNVSQPQQQLIADTITNNPQIVELIADRVTQYVSKQ